MAYTLFRSRCRSIGMQISRAGLVVRAPKSVALRDIATVLENRAQWICAQLAEWSNPAPQALPQMWRTGEPILVQGRHLELAVFPARSAVVKADLFHLQVRHPRPDDSRQIAQLVKTWLRDLATEFFNSRIAHYAAQVSSVLPQFKLSNAKTQWGSCNRAGLIHLHWQLIQVPPHLADYVVAHEVAHLVELNHSPRFWSVLAALCPHYEGLREELNALTPLLSD